MKDNLKTNTRVNRLVLFVTIASIFSAIIGISGVVTYFYILTEIAAPNYCVGVLITASLIELYSLIAIVYCFVCELPYDISKYSGLSVANGLLLWSNIVFMYLEGVI